LPALLFRKDRMKSYFLITNDDGIQSPGLLALSEAVSDLGELLIVAPSFQQTGMGRSFPQDESIGIIEEKILMVNDDSTKSYGVYGSPAQAVAYGILELSHRKPDLCLCGINYGENLGLSLTCSGTLGAAFEAHSQGIKALAFSIPTSLSKQHSESFEEIDWAPIKKVIRRILIKILKEGFPENADILNINFPELIDDSTLIKFTRQSHQNYSEFLIPPERDFKKGYELKTEKRINPNDTPINSDIYAMKYEKAVSITPLKWDLSFDLKDKSWEKDLNQKEAE